MQQTLWAVSSQTRNRHCGPYHHRHATDTVGRIITDTQLTLWAVSSQTRNWHCGPYHHSSLRYAIIVHLEPKSSSSWWPCHQQHKLQLQWCLRSSVFCRLVVCPETSVTNCQSPLCNIPEEHGTSLHRKGSLQCRMVCVSCVTGAMPLYTDCCCTLGGWKMFWTVLYD